MSSTLHMLGATANMLATCISGHTSRTPSWGAVIHRRETIILRTSTLFAKAGGDERVEDDENARSGPGNSLSTTIRRKRQEIQAALNDLGTEALEERLQAATAMPTEPRYRLAALIQELVTRQGRPVLVLEVSRSMCGPEATAEDVARTAAQYTEWGADAIAVLTDIEESPNGLADLFATCRAVKAPVLQRDWFLHLLQAVEAKQAGAAGFLGTIASVLGTGAPIMSSYAAALGLDAPVEIVNKAEMAAMEQKGVPFYGLNLAVGLSLPIPGFKSDIATALLTDMPFGAITLVGVSTEDEADAAVKAGASALLIKQEFVSSAAAKGQTVGDLIEYLQYLLSNE